MVNGTQEVPISSILSPPGDIGHCLGPKGNAPAVRPALPSSSRAHLVDFHAFDVSPPTAEHEAQPAHTWHLVTQELAHEPPPEHVEFPDEVFRAPVPDAVFSSLDDLSGCAARLCLVLMEAAYSYDPDAGQWRASPKYWAAPQLDARADMGMSNESVRRAAKELERRGWVDVQDVGGRAVYRWALDVPRERYTPVPVALMREHARLSHSAVVVLLAVYRVTWGWTVREDGTTKHRRTEALSTAQMGEITGLSAPTVRSAAQELSTIGAIERTREPGQPYQWRPDTSFFADTAHKSFPPSYSRENSIQQPRTHARSGETGPDGEKKRNEGEGAGQKRADTSLSETERRHAEWIVQQTDIPFWFAARQVSRWSSDVIQRTRGAFRQRRDDIRNPGGWLRQALRHGWFAPQIENKQPDVQQDDGDPFEAAAEAFRKATERAEGGPSLIPI